jgi:methylglutaconyl-CoA hydratase
MPEDFHHLRLAFDGPVARLVLARPERHNAFDDDMIAELDGALQKTRNARALVISAEGSSFCAGGDLGWMRRTAGYSPEENEADALRLARMLQRLDRLPAPTIALVQGGAYGGGVGLVAACDVAIASKAASFALSEVRLGLVPATIAPYVVAAIGARAARRYFVTAERFDAAEALRLGLVHEVVPADELEAAGERIVEHILTAGPAAVARAKSVVREVAARLADEALVADTARWIAEVRAGEEAREGIAAFLERREPSWRG